MNIFKDHRFLQKLQMYLQRENELPGPFQCLRKAGVVLPFSFEEGEWVLYFILRSGTVKRHAGQMAFPGGAFEAGDTSVRATGIRELEEEIGIPRHGIKVIGFVNPVVTVTGFYVYPIIAEVKHLWVPKIETYEIKKIVRVPFRALFMENCYSLQSRDWAGHQFPIHVFRYETYVIWGATGRIVANLFRRIKMMWSRVPDYPLIVREKLKNDLIISKLFRKF